MRNKFEGLDPRYHQLVEELERDYDEWRKGYGIYENFRVLDHERKVFARQRLGALSIAEIAAVFEWLTNNESFEIFESFVQVDSAEAWQILGDLEDPEYFQYAATGMIQGSERGEGWAELSSRIISLADGARFEDGFSMPEFEIRKLVAGEWFSEDSEAAVDWLSRFAPHVHDEPVAEAERIETLSDSEKEEFRQWNAQKFVVDLWISEGRARQEAIESWAEQNFPKGGVFVEGVAKQWVELADGYAPIKRVLPLIANLPAEASKEVFFQLLESLPSREHQFVDDPFGPSSRMSFEHPNVILDAARELATQIPLTPEEVAQAEAAFARVVAQEEENRGMLNGLDEE